MTPMVEFEVAGLDKFENDLAGIKPRVFQRAAFALFAIGERTMTKAKLYTPVDSGALRSTGVVYLPVVTDREVMVEMGFGGPAKGGVYINSQGERVEDVNYAARVHEDTSMRHDGAGEQAKYLETAVNETEATFVQELAGADLFG